MYAHGVGYHETEDFGNSHMQCIVNFPKRPEWTSIEFYTLPSEQIATHIPPKKPPNVRPRHDCHRPFLPFAVPTMEHESANCNQKSISSLVHPLPSLPYARNSNTTKRNDHNPNSPIQRYRHRAHPSTNQCPNHSTPYLITRQRGTTNLPPYLGIDAIDIE